MLPGNHFTRTTYGPGLLGSPNSTACSLVPAALRTHVMSAGVLKGAAMPRISHVIAAVVLAAVLAAVAYPQQPTPTQPPYATAQVEGTNNVYIFRAGNHQSMFVVTSAGVIATDPIGYGRPQMV